MAVRVGGVSKSVAKAPQTGIGRDKNRGISTILLRLSGAIGAFATDLDKPRRHGPRDGRHGSRRRPLDAPLTPRRALRTRTCSSNRHSRVQSARLDEEGASRGRSGPRRRSRSGTSSVTRWERLNERRAPPLPLCYALFSSLRLCTLCCTGKRSVAEGERAWRRERGVADGSARPREPRGR